MACAPPCRAAPAGARSPLAPTSSTGPAALTPLSLAPWGAPLRTAGWGLLHCEDTPHPTAAARMKLGARGRQHVSKPLLPSVRTPAEGLLSAQTTPRPGAALMLAVGTATNQEHSGLCAGGKPQEELGQVVRGREAVSEERTQGLREAPGLRGQVPGHWSPQTPLPQQGWQVGRVKARTQAGWAGRLCTAVPEGHGRCPPQMAGVPGMVSPWACPRASEWGPGTGSGVSGDYGYSLGSRRHSRFRLGGRGRW